MANRGAGQVSGLTYPPPPSSTPPAVSSPLCWETSAEQAACQRGQVGLSLVCAGGGIRPIELGTLTCASYGDHVYPECKVDPETPPGDAWRPGLPMLDRSGLRGFLWASYQLNGLETTSGARKGGGVCVLKPVSPIPHSLGSCQLPVH